MILGKCPEGLEDPANGRTGLEADFSEGMTQVYEILEVNRCILVLLNIDIQKASR